MDRSEELAYLGGVMDGDGYFKVTKTYRTPRAARPVYGTCIGLQQLWPGEAVRFFARTFAGEVKSWPVPGRKPMARCEFHGSRAESATRRLLPYLLLKKDQALLLLEVERLKREARKESPERYHRIEAIRQTVLALHDGSWQEAEVPLPLSDSSREYEGLGPVELGWTQEQIRAYLAGLMDSDGNFRVEKRRVRGMLGPGYRISIRCGQVVPSSAVGLLARTFGGSLRIAKPRSPNCRNLVIWSLHDTAAAPAIAALLPYLVVKRAQAYLLLDLRRLKAEGKKGVTVWEHPTRWRRPVRMRKRCYTPDQVAEFEWIHRAVQALHSGTPADPPVSSGSVSPGSQEEEAQRRYIWDTRAETR